MDSREHSPHQPFAFLFFSKSIQCFTHYSRWAFHGQEGPWALHYSFKPHSRNVNLCISAFPFPANEFICLDKWQPSADPLKSITASKIKGTANELFGDNHCLNSSFDWLSACCPLNLFFNMLEWPEGPLSLPVEHSGHFKMSSEHYFFSFAFFFFLFATFSTRVAFFLLLLLLHRYSAANCRACWQKQFSQNHRVYLKGQQQPKHKHWEKKFWLPNSRK